MGCASFEGDVDEFIRDHLRAHCPSSSSNVGLSRWIQTSPFIPCIEMRRRVTWTEATQAGRADDRALKRPVAVSSGDDSRSSTAPRRYSRGLKRCSV